MGDTASYLIEKHGWCNSFWLLIKKITFVINPDNFRMVDKSVTE